MVEPCFLQLIVIFWRWIYVGRFAHNLVGPRPIVAVADDADRRRHPADRLADTVVPFVVGVARDDCAHRLK